jgi:hypothetical protein
MGNKNSKFFVGYSSTPELACKALEYEIQKKHPDAFVTITTPEVKVPALSPRSVPRFAIARIDGKDYEVQFDKDKNGIIALINSQYL